MEKYTIERDTKYRCWLVHYNGQYLPNTYEDMEEAYLAIIEDLGGEVLYS